MKIFEIFSKTQIGYSRGLRAKGESGMGKWLSTERLDFFVKATVSHSASDTKAYTLLKFASSETELKNV